MTSQFGRGLSRAITVRSELLGALDAEPDWTFGQDRDEMVTWLAGPLATRFAIEPVDDRVPGLAVLSVFTVCAIVNDVDGARAAVADLNFHTAVNRWNVLNDPGPDGWWDAASPTRLARNSLLIGEPDPGSPCTVAVGASFVVGDPDVELPMTVMLSIVQEQVAKATAVTTNDFYSAWGEAAVVEGPHGWRQPGDWSRAVYYFDDHITPNADRPAAPLLGALIDAFDVERDGQFRTSPAAWFGSGDQTGFTCEVPYGPGPYPTGVVGLRGTLTASDTRDDETALIRGFLVDNPYMGQGLLITMELPEFPDQGDPAWWAVQLLNAQNRTRANGTTPGFAHGIGAWVSRSSGPTHVCFVPSAWQHVIPRDDLVAFFRQLLANDARLSWGARRILEDPPDWPHYTPPGQATRSLPGLAAGSEARGPHFGEPGCGQDWGALVLDDTWKYLVADDVEWARVFNDTQGFRYWTGPAVTDITSRDCSCEEPGSVIDVETTLSIATPTSLDRLMTIQREGCPLAIEQRGDLLVARSSVHVHHDSMHWARNWPTALAVAQALTAEALGAPTERRVDVSLPDGSQRLDRDGMLALWAEPEGFVSTSQAQTSAGGLLHALLVAPNPGFSLTSDGHNLGLSWSQPVTFDDDAVEVSVVTTQLSYVTHPIYGPSLRIASVLATDEPVSDESAPQINGHPDVRFRSTFTMGGFHGDPDGLGCTSLYPLAFDRTADHDGQAYFAGTALTHHQALVSFALTTLDGVESHPKERTDLATGMSDILRTYQQLLGLSRDVTVQVTVTPEMPEPTDALAGRVTWERPYPYPGAEEWPQLAGPRKRTGGQALVGTLAVDLSTGDVSPLRIIHAALSMAAPHEEAYWRDGSPLSRDAIPPNEDEWSRVIDYLIDVGLANPDSANPEESIATARLVLPESVPPTQLEGYLTGSHNSWGRALVLEIQLPPGTVNTQKANNHDEGIGSWSAEDHADIYRACLPPLLLVCATRSWVLSDIAEAASAAVRSVQQGLRSS